MITQAIDTIVCNNNRGVIPSLTERQANFIMLEKLEHGKNAEQLTKVAFRALIAYINPVHTITDDNGTKFADHQNIARILKTSFFFTYLYSTWKKGAVENFNKLIRQDISKKTNFLLT